MNRTLCGCLAFTDEQMCWDKTARQVRRHYRVYPECRAKALQSAIWLARDPIGNKRDEEDPDADTLPGVTD